jgi:hypothetical protein
MVPEISSDKLAELTQPCQLHWTPSAAWVVAAELACSWWPSWFAHLLNLCIKAGPDLVGARARLDERIGLLPLSRHLDQITGVQRGEGGG